MNLNKVYTKDDELSRIQQNIQRALDTLDKSILALDEAAVQGAEEVSAASNTLTLTNAPASITGNPFTYFRIYINNEAYIMPVWKE